jgi:hypothetical protein
MYYVFFIDGFCKKTCIYFLKTKDEAFSRFHDFKYLVENQIGNKRKFLRLNPSSRKGLFVGYVITESHPQIVRG